MASTRVRQIDELMEARKTGPKGFVVEKEWFDSWAIYVMKCGRKPKPPDYRKITYVTRNKDYRGKVTYHRRLVDLSGLKRGVDYEFLNEKYKKTLQESFGKNLILFEIPKGALENQKDTTENTPTPSPDAQAQAASGNKKENNQPAESKDAKSPSAQAQAPEGNKKENNQTAQKPKDAESPAGQAAAGNNQPAKNAPSPGGVTQRENKELFTPTGTSGVARNIPDDKPKGLENRRNCCYANAVIQGLWAVSLGSWKAEEIPKLIADFTSKPDDHQQHDAGEFLLSILEKKKVLESVIKRTYNVTLKCTHAYEGPREETDKVFHVTPVQGKTIQDLINAEQKGIELDYECATCHRKRATKTYERSIPQGRVVIVCLERAVKDGEKNRVEVKLEDTIKWPTDSGAYRTFRLRAVLSHFGTGTNAGHFITIRREGGRIWKCDDEVVTQLHEMPESSQDAYLLFYEQD